uniref:Uncharacterized protein n=1 Tax=Pyxicephalus adspersus TaxID=30357 RepID=A0AAV3AYZ3_PYXAD|nr:TPA: hypothetical protein GDO54_000428 [Pyxicephalus adspersus]
MKLFSSADVQRLFCNKYVAVLGDSIQRSVYKYLVKILQNDEFQTESQLKKKGEMSFANDTIDLHLVQFYFLTRVSSEYIESMLAAFEQGPQPSVVKLNGEVIAID